MNAAFLLTTAAWLSGADAPAIMPAPAAAPAPAMAAAPLSSAPVISSSGGSCGGNCGGTASCGCECKPSLLDKLKALFHKESCGCEAAPTCGCEAPKHSFFTKKEKCGECDPCKEKHEGLFSKLFHKKGCDTCDSCSTCGSPVIGSGTPATIPVGPVESIKKPNVEEPAKPMPDKKSTMLMPSAIEVAPPTSNVADAETKHPFDLSRRYETRVDRAADYSWITGQLFYVHADGGLWVLRYAPVGQEDQNGGGVILARTNGMDSYREGDLVTVRGEVLKERGSLYLGAPLYRASTMELVDRGR